MTEKANIEETINPIADRVFCKRVERDDKTIGGIIIPETAQKKPREAVVIAVGPGHLTPEGKEIPLRVLPGMKVILPEHGGTELEIGDEKYQIVHEHEIMAVIGVVEAPESEKA